MAGRKKKNTVDYFPHYIGEGKKIQYIEAKYGNDGYASWFKILESLATTPDHYIDLNDEIEKVFLANKCKVKLDVLEAILEDLAMLGSINKIMWSKRIIWSEIFVESIKDTYKKRSSIALNFEDLFKHLFSAENQKSTISDAEIIKTDAEIPISGGNCREIRKEENKRIGKEEKRKEENSTESPETSSGVSKSAGQKPVSFQYKCRLIFEKFYLEKFKEEYYFKKQDAGNLKNLLNSINFKIKEKNKIDQVPEEKTIEGLKFFLDRAYSTADQFIKGSFTISTLYSKFNEIYLKISKNGKQSEKPNTESRQQRIDEVADLGSLAKQIIANGG